MICYPRPSTCYRQPAYQMNDDSEESTEQDDTTEGHRVTGMMLTEKQEIDYRDHERNDHRYSQQG